jgi:hypothetical protein
LEEATANLQRFEGKEVAGNLINLLGGCSMLGMMVGLGLLARSMQAGGATMATLCGYIFPGLVALMIIGFGTDISAQEILSEGSPEVAGAASLAGNGVFGAFPLFWGLGILLLGLGITREDGPLPAIFGWIMAVVGAAMMTVTFVDPGGDAIGFVIWLGVSITILVLGVLSLLAIRKAA